jgi:UDP-N-acetyl-L-fucosamine synthase
MMKVMTILGTRPEIVRLSRTMALLDQFTDHVLVHTGQNYDVELNEVLFADLAIRSPDVTFALDTSSLSATLGGVLSGTEAALFEHRPDAVVVLGDTNSSISALIARRHQVPVYHLEAGNRSFDDNVPEEINRRMIDHLADYNLAYTEQARHNLLAEGLPPSRVTVTGTPMREVLDHQAARIASSRVLTELDLVPDGYLLASVHREENVDEPGRLRCVLDGLAALSKTYELPVLLSTHPRTRHRLQGLGDEVFSALRLHEPFSFTDYVRLQQSARCVLSDSGTISEESAILNFAAVTLRPSIERPEAIESGTIITAGIEPEAIVDAVRITLASRVVDRGPTPPAGYEITNFSERVVKFIRSTANTHHELNAIRKRSSLWSAGLRL